MRVLAAAQEQASMLASLESLEPEPDMFFPSRLLRKHWRAHRARRVFRHVARSEPQDPERVRCLLEAMER